MAVGGEACRRKCGRGVGAMEWRNGRGEIGKGLRAERRSSHCGRLGRGGGEGTVRRRGWSGAARLVRARPPCSLAGGGRRPGRAHLAGTTEAGRLGGRQARGPRGSAAQLVRRVARPPPPFLLHF